MPLGDPKALEPQRMCGRDEICKGLGGFLNLWSTMVNDDSYGKFKLSNEPISQYWRDAKEALDLSLPSTKTLRNGF